MQQNVPNSPPKSDLDVRIIELEREKEWRDKLYKIEKRRTILTAIATVVSFLLVVSAFFTLRISDRGLKNAAESLALQQAAAVRTAENEAKRINQETQRIELDRRNSEKTLANAAEALRIQAVSAKTAAENEAARIDAEKSRISLEKQKLFIDVQLKIFQNILSKATPVIHYPSLTKIDPKQTWITQFNDAYHSDRNLIVDVKVQFALDVLSYYIDKIQKSDNVIFLNGESAKSKGLQAVGDALATYCNRKSIEALNFLGACMRESLSLNPPALNSEGNPTCTDKNFRTKIRDWVTPKEGLEGYKLFAEKYGVDGTPSSTTCEDLPHRKFPDWPERR